MIEGQGRRWFLKLAGATAVFAGGGPAAAEGAPEGALTIPAPSGFEVGPPDESLRELEAILVADAGLEVIARFVTAEDPPFIWTVFRPADASRDDAAAFGAQREALQARFAPYERPDHPPLAFGNVTDLRLERRIATGDAFFWLGSWSDDAGAGLLMEGLLWLGSSSLRFSARGARRPGEPAVPPGPRVADGGVAVSPFPGGGVTFSIAKPLPASERASLAADAGQAWVVLDAWIDAVRVSNGLPALTVHDVAGVPIVIPAPAGFTQEPVDPRLGPLDARYPDITFVANGETMAPPERTRIAVSPRGTILSPGVTRPMFEMMLLQLRLATAEVPAFDGLAVAADGPVSERVGVAETGDSFAMLFVSGARSDAYLNGQAHLWVAGSALAVLMTSRSMAGSDATIRRAWDIFRDWVAAVIAANELR